MMRLRGLMRREEAAERTLEVSPLATTRLSRQEQAYDVNFATASELLVCGWSARGAGEPAAMSNKRSNIRSEK